MPCLDRDLELGADAVGARDQDRILEAGGLEVEQAAEAAQPAHHAAPVGAPGERLDVLDEGIAGIDVDSPRPCRSGAACCGRRCRQEGRQASSQAHSC
jgi:hypothetical protein